MIKYIVDSCFEDYKEASKNFNYKKVNKITKKSIKYLLKTNTYEDLKLTVDEMYKKEKRRYKTFETVMISIYIPFVVFSNINIMNLSGYWQYIGLSIVAFIVIYMYVKELNEYKIDFYEYYKNRIKNYKQK